ncbi:DUF4199 domain-containing protein [Arthrospiribacter ruber]|uniref:DUF4199 domain-containing protein n=1 Tax=Arthrospiribacter ruber TaxID=2487934 RepID=A0A951MIV2_9BACT|nr:DUF4199 domain-containing protein [Arthrospiribacter ruber]MBW3470485.1 DUF4199 domain-containing protein [Arthrospiribacter ruber]
MEEKTTVGDVAKKWGLIYGLIGLIYIIVSTVFDFATQGVAMQVISFLVTLILAFTVYFLACKEYKDDNEGLISFGRAFGLIALIGVIGGAIRAVGLYLYLKFIDTDYLVRIQEAQEEMRERMGAPEIDPDQIPEFMKFFQTTEFMGIATFINVMLGVLVIGLIVAAIVQKKEEYTY